ncbi:MAG: SGNH/GDSL hydrolase family protein [Planctomycetaceae bacterium]
MKLKCPACVKHISCAVFALLVLVLSLEAGLRIYDGRTGSISGPPAAQSPLMVTSARAHHELKPLIAVETPHPDTGRPVSLTTNSLGLRGAEVAVPKPAGVYRILLLGDDSTLAIETPESETACRKLQELLQRETPLRVEVVNAGVPGYCPLLSFLFYRHALLGLQPDLIVLNFDMSDVADDHRYRRFTRMGPGGQPLVCADPEQTSRYDRPRVLPDRFLLVTWAKRQIGRFSTSRSAQNESDDLNSPQGKYAWIRDRAPDMALYVRQAMAPIESLHALAERSGARLIVSAVPAPWQVSANASNSGSVRRSAGVPRSTVYRGNRPFELLGAFLRKREIPYCNPIDAFRSFPKPHRLYLRNAAAFSAVGHELLARQLSRTILAEVPDFRRHNAPPPSTRQTLPIRSASRRKPVR